MGHPNGEVVQRLFGAFSAGDVETVGQLLADDVTLHVPGRSPSAGVFEGKPAVLGAFEKMSSAMDESFEADVHTILADDEHVAVLITEKGEKNGKTYSWNEVDVFHVDDGRVTEMWVVFEDLYAADEYFSSSVG